MQEKKIKDEFLSMQDVSELLRISLPTLRNWDRRGALVAYRNPVNNYRTYRLSQIEKFINEMESSRKGKRFRIKVVSVEE